MPHVEPDVLALLALGEDVASPEELAHVEGCLQGGSELANLTRTAKVGRTALGAGELLTPPPRVWDRIVAELDQQESLPPAVQPDATGAVEDDRALPAPIPLRPRRRAPLLAAAAAAVVLVAGGAVTWQLLRPSSPDVLATADLAPFPAWAGAGGTAQLEETRDGQRVVRVSLDAPSTDTGYREVWLISSDATRLVSLGVLDGSEGTFPVPRGVDTSTYDLVDISEEPVDGDPAHSGDSIVRGQLEA